MTSGLSLANKVQFLFGIALLAIVAHAAGSVFGLIGTLQTEQGSAVGAA